MNQVKMYFKAFLIGLLLGTVCAKQYFLFKNRMNWYKAYQDCRTRNMQLATINSAVEQADLQRFMGQQHALRDWVWTSGTDQGEHGTYMWMSTGLPFSFTRWGVNQPDNAGNNEHCIHLWFQHDVITWNDIACTTKMFYVCERPLTFNH